jgi:hypothetical protein
MEMKQKEAFVLLFALAGTGYGMYELVNPGYTAKAGFTCCESSDQCTQDQLCCWIENSSCALNPGTADYQYYCMTSCNGTGSGSS